MRSKRIKEDSLTSEKENEKKFYFYLTLSIGVPFKMNFENYNNVKLLFKRADEAVYSKKVEDVLINTSVIKKDEDSKINNLLSQSDTKSSSLNLNVSSNTKKDNLLDFNLENELEKVLNDNGTKITQASLFEDNNIIEEKDVEFPIDEFSDLLNANSTNEIEELLINYLIPTNYNKIEEKIVDFLRINASFENINSSKGLLKKRFLKTLISEILPISDDEKKLIRNKFAEDVSNISATIIYLNNFFANSGKVIFKVIDNEVIVNKKQELEFLLKEKM